LSPQQSQDQVNLENQSPAQSTSRPNYYAQPDINDSHIVFGEDSQKLQRARGQTNSGGNGKKPNLSIKEALEIENIHQNILRNGIAEDEIMPTFRQIFNVSHLLTPRRGFSASSPRGMGTSLAEPAACQPEHITVPIELTNSSEKEFIYPSCTRLRRCGGCCNHELLSCLPSQITFKDLSILVLDLETGEDSKQTIQMEEHESCSCGCKVQPHHCNPLQIHDPDGCECKCIGIARCPDDKIWDPVACECACRNQEDVHCSTGLVFDTDTCRCDKMYRRLDPLSSRPPINNGRRTHRRNNS